MPGRSWIQEPREDRREHARCRPVSDPSPDAGRAALARLLRRVIAGFALAAAVGCSELPAGGETSAAEERADRSTLDVADAIDAPASNEATPVPTEVPSQPDPAAPLADPAPPVGSAPPLENLITVAPGVLSGGEPKGPIAYRALALLGVRTIVCVDAPAPDERAAAEHGIRVIHAPIGYDGVPTEAQAIVARAIRDLEGTVYVHCHHGKHRGPAALASALRRLDRIDAPAAADLLRRAGTSPSYPGLHAAVGDATPWTNEEIDRLAPELPSRSVVTDLAAAMARLDRHWGHLGRLAERGWSLDPDHPDLVPAAEAGVVADLLRACASLESTSRRHAAELEASASLVAHLEAMLSAPAPDRAAVDTAFAEAGSSCVDCHRIRRDVLESSATAAAADRGTAAAEAG